MLRYMREGLVEKIRALAHCFFKVIFGLACMLPRAIKVFLGAPELVLHAFEALHCACVWRHLVEIGIQRPDLLEQLLFQFLVGLLF